MVCNEKTFTVIINVGQGMLALSDVSSETSITVVVTPEQQLCRIYGEVGLFDITARPNL